MRWFKLVLLCAVIAMVCADPDPKKYKPEVKAKEIEANSSLTGDEIKFLREVEAKFGIKSEVPIETSEETSSKDEDDDKPPPSPVKLPFPAVIAIEIVNDTDSKTKGKRTIDANLGYGYQTNRGYTYTYFGKSGESKGKFMIYPYSQEDIPPVNPTPDTPPGYPKQIGKTTKLSPNVEITPSQAFELVPTKEEETTSYNYEKPAVQLNTKYENAQGVETPPPPYPSSHSSPPSTLYTTYNGQQFSRLSGQFPKVMSNYLVDPSQLLSNPSYQGAGLTQEHLRPHGNNLGQRVVPVLVLRIPSSYIKNPSAELYANLPQNYPLSQYLNNVNLQELVNQYFSKIGYQSAPKVMAYPSSYLSHSTESAPAAHVPNYEPQHYASPYVQPSYTHADYSGVQYSAVQPVMAKYPSGYMRQHYYVMRPRPLYQQPLQQPQYVYKYKYDPQTSYQSHSYYTQPQYEKSHTQYQKTQSQYQEAQPQYQEAQPQYQEAQPQYQEAQPQYQEAQPQYQEVQSQYQEARPQYQEAQPQYQESQPQYEQETEEEHHRPSSYDTSSQVEYSHQQTTSDEEQHIPSTQYEDSHSQTAQEYESPQHVTSSYEGSTASPSYDQSTPAPEYGPTHSPSVHGSSPSVQVEYEQPAQKETIAVYPRSQTGHKTGVAQSYIYQKMTNEHSGAESLVLHENYPSKDHTVATVLPLSYKNQNTEPVQAVSYVTPMPTMKYHSHYRVMVPQTVLKRPTSEKVSYVNSHSLPSSYSQLGASNQYNPEEEYTVSNHYVPPVSKQKPPTYPWNYHAHPKRMAKPENKSDSPASRKSEKKKSS